MDYGTEKQPTDPVSASIFFAHVNLIGLGKTKQVGWFGDVVPKEGTNVLKDNSDAAQRRDNY